MLTDTAAVDPDSSGQFSFQEVEMEDNASQKLRYSVVVYNPYQVKQDIWNPLDETRHNFKKEALVNLTAEPDDSAPFYEIELEPLEGYVVNSTGDAKDEDLADDRCDTGSLNPAGETECTLRAAIQQANAFSGEDSITFSIPGDGPHRIRPASGLPEITDSVIIDASTQTSGTEEDSGPMITLDGARAGNVNGYHVTVKNVTIIGHRIINFNGLGRSGIYLDKTSGSCRIEGNVIGLSASGRPSGNGRGILIDSSDNIIGGITDTPGQMPGNVVSANLRGISIYAENNQVLGNLIGPREDGTDLGRYNQDGVYIRAPGNTIGGTEEGAGNVISGNGGSGIHLVGQEATGNRVLGNLIGTNINGDQALGNKLSWGVCSRTWKHHRRNRGGGRQCYLRQPLIRYQCFRILCLVQ